MTAQEAYILAKAYTKKSIEGAGSLKGSACQIKSIEEITGGHRITFEWENNDGEVSTDTMDVMDGADGNDGVGISSITYKETDAHGNYVYTVTLTDTNTYDIICPKGAQGETGATGATGNGIASIVKTSTAGLVDTYTITYTNGQTTTFTVTNGESITVDSAMSDSSTNPVQNKVITEALALKQDVTDNSLDTEEKTIVGAINEHEGDIDSLKSGFTNLDNEVNGDATVYPYADVITIEDAVPANLADCSVKVEPVQDLHGYDKPWVGGAGKNKENITLTSGTYSGVSWTVYDDKRIKISGTVPGGGVTLNTAIADIDTTALAGYKFVYSTEGSGTFYARIMNSDLSANLQDLQNGTIIADNGSNCKLAYRIPSNASIDKTISSMIVASTETDLSYAPYENICPISGHTEVDVQRARPNMLDGLEQGLYASNGIKVNDNKQVRSSDYIDVIGSESYVISTDTTGLKVYVSQYSVKDTTRIIGSDWQSLPYTFTTESNAKYIHIMFKKNNNNDLSPSEVVNPRCDTLSAYGEIQTYTLALGDTIYGGTVDFDSGVMTVDRAFISLTSGAIKTGTYSVAYPSSVLQAKTTGVISNVAEGDLSEGYRIGISNGVVHLYSALMYIGDGTIESYNTWNASNPVEVCYELATPTTVQLTPEQIQLLQGTNTLYASTGDISVTVNGVSGSIGSLTSDKQDKTDYALETTAKTVVGGINELKNRVKVIEVTTSDTVDQGTTVQVPTGYDAAKAVIVGYTAKRTNNLWYNADDHVVVGMYSEYLYVVPKNTDVLEQTVKVVLIKFSA